MGSLMSKRDFTKAIEACVENGERLCYDAESCSSPTGIALAILTQEEFAKAFMLNLVNEGIIPWTQGVQKSIKNHECKHLFVLIMAYLASIEEPVGEWRERLESGKRVQIPSHIRDAINIYRHEKVERYEGKYLTGLGKSSYHNIPKQIGFNKTIDTKKQRSFYIEISSSGEVINVPNANEKEVEEEIERARNIEYILLGVASVYDYYREIQNGLKWVFQDISDSAKEHGIAYEI